MGTIFDSHSKEEEFSARALVRTFDVVGATDRYEEFLLMLSDVVGLRHPQYTVSVYTHTHRKHTSSPRIPCFLFVVT